MKAIIACAGTGGHINPGIAIANVIKEKDSTSEILFIGTDRGLESDLVSRAGYNLQTIDAYGLSKEISIDNFKKIIKTLKGFSQSKKIIKEFKPDVVIGTGGYICGAVITSANKLRIPTMLHESNAFPGKAVKMLLKRTDVIMVSFEEAKKRLTKAKKVVVTGTPVKTLKKELTMQEKIALKERYKLNPAKPVVLAFGGSQGAKVINDAIIDIAVKKLNKSYQILLSSGQKQYDYVKEELKKRGLKIENLEGIRIEPYMYELQKVMNTCDIICSRAGAITITEIANFGKPSILIPLPNVSHNHQQYNAEVLENLNASKIIQNSELTAEKLNFQIEEMLERGTLEKMGENARKASQTNTQEKIYDEIINLIKGNLKYE